MDEKLKADIYDIDLENVLNNMLKRLSNDIEKYKERIKNNINDHETQDLPFGQLYRDLLEKYHLENIISILLHVDGISLTRSTRLKMWLFSGSLVELPPLLRYRRYNMLLLSIWVGCTEPEPHIWLKSIVPKINYIKTQGDCPALRLILNFIGHGGYFCCWYCYLQGEHVHNKRQYKYEERVILRDSMTYLQESKLVYKNNVNVFEHVGVTVLEPIMDMSLPDSIIADYLHICLLGHAKAIIRNLYESMKPFERIELDEKLNEQPFPHYFNRKMRKVANFAYVKGNEIKNILFYGLLPLFQLYLPMEKLSHIALYVCFIRLLHGDAIFGHETCTIADKLFCEYYRDHDDYYKGLQNLVLHLHLHLTTIYKNHGALSNIGCFGQEDLIGEIGTNHHGTRYFGELITFYYNIDFAVHNESSISPNVFDKPYDLVPDLFHQYNYVHGELCDCEMPHECFHIYRRFMINRQVYHSLIYNKRNRSIFSPSNPLQPYYYLVAYDYPLKHKIVGRTSVQKITNDKAVINNINGEVQIIASGTLEYCQRELKKKIKVLQFEGRDFEDDSESNNDEVENDDGDESDVDDSRLSNYNESSTNLLKRPARGFSTPALKRSTKMNVKQRRTLNHSSERNKQIQSVISVANNPYDKTNKCRSLQERASELVDDEFGFTTQSNDDDSNIDTCDAGSSTSTIMTKMMGEMRLLRRQVSKLTKTVSDLVVPPSGSSKNDSLEHYRNEKESENFNIPVMWKGKNLLDIVARDPGHFGRSVLRELYTEAELQSSLLPSQSSHLYQKDVLDPVRFEILNEAVRKKYRLSRDGYRRYYTNTLRIKLSRFLYDSGPRKVSKTSKENQVSRHHQRATTNELFLDTDRSTTAAATNDGAHSNTGSTTTGCPTNVCTYSTWYTLSSGGYYGVEHVNINCTQTLSNFTAQIVVETNWGATFANQYNTFWSNTVIQTQTNSSSQITYMWSIITGQTIAGSGFPYFIEAQFQLPGQNQTVSNDTYSIQTVAACNGQVLTQTGHF
ncbi:unnamed protein product [Rotaria magnacalcarata]|uniref:Uncharacterized protein n=3 Tax=Rotaria magnacalcarata TaxID=392030 RepID=A0A819YUX2_9BILA|nr:unnamed protein product [Rotaria magnacalcarata]